jgi:hypothetical protein
MLGDTEALNDTDNNRKGMVMQVAITTQIYVKTLKRADDIGCDKKMTDRVRFPRQEEEDRRTRQSGDRQPS